MHTQMARKGGSFLPPTKDQNKVPDGAGALGGALPGAGSSSMAGVRPKRYYWYAGEVYAHGKNTEKRHFSSCLQRPKGMKMRATTLIHGVKEAKSSFGRIRTPSRVERERDKTLKNSPKMPYVGPRQRGGAMFECSRNWMIL